MLRWWLGGLNQQRDLREWSGTLLFSFFEALLEAGQTGGKFREAFGEDLILYVHERRMFFQQILHFFAAIFFFRIECFLDFGPFRLG